MADIIGQQDLRGLNVDKIAKGFADEAIVLKRYCHVSSTSATQIRWYQKTAGFLDSTDTTGITASKIPSSAGSLPSVIGPSWTRNTSYTKPYVAESELMTMQDIRACDVDVLATTIRDLVRAVERQVEQRIYNVITTDDVGTGSNTLAITNEWDDDVNAVPIEDLLKCRQYLSDYNYNPDGAIFALRPEALRFLVNHLISVRGSSIPEFASRKVETGVVMQICGFQVVETSIVTSDKAVIFVPQVACTWKSLTPISSAVIEEPLLGKKVRVLEEGEALLTDPRAVVFISNIGPT
jgi:hypothetical protein|tara:strand:+ start:1660 stop:2541 length:882 start_codon:yes stop_codon:yes gene_type:complete